MLDDTGQRGDGLGSIDAFTYEERSHDVVDRESSFGDEFAHCRGCAQATGARNGKHAPMLRAEGRSKYRDEPFDRRLRGHCIDAEADRLGRGLRDRSDDDDHTRKAGTNQT